MATRIRRAGVAVALALLMATALTGAAYAKLISGTNGADDLVGTAKADQISGYNNSQRFAMILSQASWVPGLSAGVPGRPSCIDAAM